jgi:hypothetical protein
VFTPDEPSKPNPILAFINSVLSHDKHPSLLRHNINNSDKKGYKHCQIEPSGIFFEKGRPNDA